MDETSTQAAADVTAQRNLPILRIVGCGFLIGTADAIPGVSGGTVALILGVYRRLVAGISSIDADFILLPFQGRFREWWRRGENAFLVILAVGIVAGFGSLLSVMKYLLLNHRTLTFAAFSGMVIASVLVVAKRIDRWTPARILLTVAAAAFALRIVTLPALKNPPDSLWYLFGCGMVGITAMILPGISGAFILLILQRYFYVIEKVKAALHFNWSLEVLVPLVVFCLGCLTGLLSFSRILNWLLTKFEQATVSVLCGLMIGATYCLWPFQRDKTPEILDPKLKEFQHYLPDAMSGEIVAAGFIFVIAFFAVLALEKVSSKRTATTPA